MARRQGDDPGSTSAGSPSSAFEGQIDGIWRQELQTPLEQWVRNEACDPLPANEPCRAATS